MKWKATLIVIGIIFFASLSGTFLINKNEVSITDFSIVNNVKSIFQQQIIIITKATHLDSNKNIISDIYEEIKELDDIWSPTISENEYARVTFEKNLTNKNDITIYPRIASGEPRIEIYEKDGNEIIAEFSSIKENEYNKIFLTNLIGEQDTFDLKILRGSIEFDHIIDPTTTPTFYNVTTNFNSATHTSLSVSHTISGENTLLLVFCQGENQAVSNATFQNIGMTNIPGASISGNGAMISAWYIVGRTGSGTATCTLASQDNSGIVAISYTGVNQTSPIGNVSEKTATDTANPTFNLISTFDNSLIIDVITGDGGDMHPITNVSGQTRRWQFRSGTSGVADTAYAGGETQATIVGNYILNWTQAASDGYSIVGIEIKGIIESDTAFPTFSSLTETPTDPATYSSANTYEFNSTWADNGAVSAVIINFNGVNSTISRASGTAQNGVYRFTTSNLSVGSYNYYWWANDTSSNSNNTLTLSYTINKAIPSGTISGTTPITYGTTADIQGTESNIGDGDVTYNLYRNNISVSNPDNSLLGAGIYNYIYNSTEGQNYSANSTLDTFALTVNQNTAACIVLFSETSPIPYPQTFTVWSNCNSDFTLKRDETIISNNSLQELVVGSYNFTVTRTDTQNYSNIYDEEIFVITKAAPTINLTLDGFQRNVTINASQSIYLNVSQITGDSGATLSLYLDNSLINQGVSPISNLTLFSTTGNFNVTSFYLESTSFTAASQTWFVNVVFSDTCTCPGLNSNWEIDMTDSCNIIDACNLGTGNITFIGTGTTTFNALINSKNLKYPTTNQNLNIGSNALVMVG